MNEIYFKRKIYSILNDNKFDREITNLKSGRVDFKKLYKTAVNSDRLFKQKREREGKHYSVVLLVDCSGSMRSKAENASLAAAKAYKALIESNVSVQVMTFNSIIQTIVPFDFIATEQDVRDHLYNHTIDDCYTEVEFSEQTRTFYPSGRHSAEAGSYNFDALGVMNARESLKRKEGEKVLLVYSDGQPAPSAHPEYMGMDEYQFLKHEIATCKKNNIICLGLGIHSDAVKNYYPKYEVIWDSNEILPTTIKLLSKYIKRK